MKRQKSIPASAFAHSRMFAVSLVCFGLLSLLVSGVAFAQSSPASDSLTLTASPDMILRGDDMSVIVANFTSDGVPYNGCPVTFTVDRSDIAYIINNNTNVTGTNGETMVYIASDDTPGTVTVTAETKAPGSTNAIKATITLTVVDWGTIGGTVFDRSFAPVPGAHVTLSHESGEMFWVPENPQNTSERYAPVGSFSFYRIPVGKYVLSWDAAGMFGSQPVTVSEGTSTVIFNENRSFLFPGYTDAPYGQTTLYGYVLDKYKNGVPSAAVELYNTVYNSSGNTWDTLTPVAETRANNSLNYSGLYSFSNIPYGTYKVVANKMDPAGNNHTYYSIVTLNSSGQVAYIVIPDLVPHSHPPIAPPSIVTPSGQPTSVSTPSQDTDDATATQTDLVKAVPVVIGIIVVAGLLLFVLRLTSRR
jgi:Bacterial Ig-like domain (group 1).